MISLRPIALRRSIPALTRPPPSRTFLPNPFAFASSASASNSNANVQSLTATRTLPYKSSDIYNIIADVSAYSSFLPYCQDSKITKWSQPDAQSGHRWPSEATLVVGWQNISEEFSSRIYCVPGRIVEAVSGGSVTQLKAEEIAHHNEGNGNGNEYGSEKLADEFMTSESRPAHSNQPPPSSTTPSNHRLLTHLLTRWTVSPFPYKPPPTTGAEPPAASANTSDSNPADTASSRNPVDPQAKTQHPAREQTQVSLAIEFAFANPLYGTMSAAVAPKVAGMMIEAFEKRVETLLDGPGHGLGGSRAKVPGEGVVRKGGML